LAIVDDDEFVLQAGSEWPIHFHREREVLRLRFDKFGFPQFVADISDVECDLIDLVWLRIGEADFLW
jgi:hypothetical protein